MVVYNTRPFAYNPGSQISGTTQYGNLAVGDISVEYSLNYGGLTWWMGPDENSGYFIAYVDVTNSHPTEIIGTTASVGFLGPKAFTTQDFINLVNSIPARSGSQPFTNDMDAYNWVMNNGYWTNYLSVTPTPNGGSTSTPTPTPTLTPTLTPTNTSTSTPTPTITPTASQASVTLTPTPTPTPTPALTYPTFPYLISINQNNSNGACLAAKTVTVYAFESTYSDGIVMYDSNTPSFNIFGGNDRWYGYENIAFQIDGDGYTYNSVACPSSTPTPTPTHTTTPTPTHTITPTPSVTSTSTPTPTPTQSESSTYYTIVITQTDLDNAINSGANNNRVRVTYKDENGSVTVKYYTIAGTYTNDICVQSGQPVSVTYFVNGFPGGPGFATSTATDTLVSCGANAPTETPTPTPSVTATSTTTPTPTPSVTATSTTTPTPTPSVTTTNTPTPTPSGTPSSASAPMVVTISEDGSNVVMTASGTVDLTGLTLVDSNFGPIGGGGLGINTATFICGNNGSYASTYSGFTTTPSNFGSGSGLPPSSASGDYFGVIMNGQPPYLLLVPTGYTSGTNITSTQTFNNTTLSTLGLTNGTYTYTWSGGSIDVVVGGPSPTPTPTPSAGANSGSGSWYFYSDAGMMNAGPPSGNGNVLMWDQTTGMETFDPNYVSGHTFQIYFNPKDSTGTSYLTQFSGLTTGGTITLSQNGDTATYVGAAGTMTLAGPPGNQFFVMNFTGGAGISQTKTSNAPFVYADPISITFGS